MVGFRVCWLWHFFPGRNWAKERLLPQRPSPYSCWLYSSTLGMCLIPSALLDYSLLAWGSIVINDSLLNVWVYCLRGGTVDSVAYWSEKFVETGYPRGAELLGKIKMLLQRQLELKSQEAFFLSFRQKPPYNWRIQPNTFRWITSELSCGIHNAMW